MGCVVCQKCTNTTCIYAMPTDNMSMPTCMHNISSNKVYKPTCHINAYAGMQYVNANMLCAGMQYVSMQYVNANTCSMSMQTCNIPACMQSTYSMQWLNMHLPTCMQYAGMQDDNVQPINVYSHRQINTWGATPTPLLHTWQLFNVIKRTVQNLFKFNMAYKLLKKYYWIACKPLLKPDKNFPQN